MIEWISHELAEAVHDRQLAEHGGSPGVRDENLLNSALARPQQLYAYGQPAPDICDLAASLAFGIARNHPFIDGNKRTAWVCCRLFMALNHSKFDASQEDKYINMLKLAEGLMQEAEFADWLRKHTHADTPVINEPPAEYQVND